MKKIIIVLSLFCLCACQAQTTPSQKSSSSKLACDATSIKEECDSKNTKTIEFHEISFDEAIQYFTNQKSGILFFGFSTCPWCKEARPILKKVAQEKGLDIQYIKTRDEDKNKLYSDEQKAQIEPYIQEYMSNNDEGELTLYVPLVLIVQDGKVIDGHVGTVDGHDATQRKMTKKEKKELIQIYTKLLSEAN